ncbi:MAG: FxsA family protein [Rhodospirillales bacterium]|nr:FxsA family protein [Rhodospirillales bacterium]
MGLVLFGVMIVVPILEIAVFIVVGRFIGLWPTLAGILATALIGTAIIRHQGVGIIAKARQTINAGEAPVGAVLEGLALLVAGALLVTPGFVTDTLGFLLLIPPLRQAVAASLVARAVRRAEVRVQASRTGPGGNTDPRTRGGPGATPPGAGVTIEGEWQDLTETGPEDHQHDSGDPEPGRGWGRSGERRGGEDGDPPARMRTPEA